MKLLHILLFFVICYHFREVISLNSAVNAVYDTVIADKERSNLDYDNVVYTHGDESNDFLNIETIEELQNVTAKMLFLTDYIFAPVGSNGGYAYSSLRHEEPTMNVNNIIPVSTTCIATASQYYHPMTFAEFWESFSTLEEIDTYSWTDVIAYEQRTMESQKEKSRGRYSRLDLESSCYHEFNNSSSINNGSNIQYNSAQKCAWKLNSEPEDCLEEEHESLSTVNALKIAQTCNTSSDLNNERYDEINWKLLQKQIHTANIMFADFVNVYLPRRTLLHESIMVGADFATDILVTTATLKEAFRQLNWSATGVNYMDDAMIFQRKVFDEYNKLFYVEYDSYFHTKWMLLQEFATMTISSAIKSGEVLLSDYLISNNNKIETIHNFVNIKNYDTECAVNEQQSIYKWLSCNKCYNENSSEHNEYNKREKLIYSHATKSSNTSFVREQIIGLVHDRIAFACPLVTNLSMYNFSQQRSFEFVNKSTFAEWTLEMLESLLHSTETMNFSNATEGVELLHHMFCFMTSYLITSFTIYDQVFFTATSIVQNSLIRESSSTWLIHFLEQLNVDDVLAQLATFHERVKSLQESRLRLLESHVGREFIECIFTFVIITTTETEPTSLPKFGSDKQTIQENYNMRSKPTSLNQCIEPILQEYRLLYRNNINKETSWRFDIKNVSRKTVDYMNSLLLETFIFAESNNNIDVVSVDVDDYTGEEYSSESKWQKYQESSSSDNYVNISTIYQYNVESTTNSTVDRCITCNNDLSVDVCKDYYEESSTHNLKSFSFLCPTYKNLVFPVGYATFDLNESIYGEVCTNFENVQANFDKDNYRTEEINQFNNVYTFTNTTECSPPVFTTSEKQWLCEKGTYYAMNKDRCEECNVWLANELILPQIFDLFANEEVAKLTNSHMLSNHTFASNSLIEWSSETSHQDLQITHINSEEKCTSHYNISAYRFSFCPGDGEMHRCPSLQSNYAVYKEAERSIRRTEPRNACKYYCNNPRYAPMHNDCVTAPQFYFNSSDWSMTRCVLPEIIHDSDSTGIIVGSGVSDIATSCPFVLRYRYWSNKLSYVPAGMLPFMECTSNTLSSCTLHRDNTMWTILIASLNFSALGSMHDAALMAEAVEKAQYAELDNLSKEDKGNSNREYKLSSVKHLLASFSPTNKTHTFVPFWSLYLVTERTNKENESYNIFLYLETNVVETLFNVEDSNIDVNVERTNFDRATTSEINMEFNNDIKDDKVNTDIKQKYTIIKSDEWLLTDNNTPQTWNLSVLWMAQERLQIRFYLNEREISSAIPVRKRLEYFEEEQEEEEEEHEEEHWEESFVNTNHAMQFAFGGEVAQSSINDELRVNILRKDDTRNHNNNIIIQLPLYADYLPANVNAFTRTFHALTPAERHARETLKKIQREEYTDRDYVESILTKWSSSQILILPTTTMHGMRLRSKLLTKQATQINRSVLQTCRSGFGKSDSENSDADNIIGGGGGGSSSDTITSVANKPISCFLCPVASYTQTQFHHINFHHDEEFFSTESTELEYNASNVRSVCTCIDTWEWEKATNTCIRRTTDLLPPIMEFYHSTFVVPDDVIDKHTHENITDNELSGKNLIMEVVDQKTSLILLGWGSAIIATPSLLTLEAKSEWKSKSKVESMYLQYMEHVNNMEIVKNSEFDDKMSAPVLPNVSVYVNWSYECTSSITKIDSKSSDVNMVKENNITFYSTAALGLGEEVCSIHTWVVEEPAHLSLANSRCIHFVMRPNALLQENINFPNMTVVLPQQRLLIISIINYTMLPEFSLYSLLQLPEISVNQRSVIEYAFEKLFIKVNLNCSNHKNDLNESQRKTKVINETKKEHKWDIYSKIIDGRDDDINVLLTKESNSSNVIIYSHGLLYIYLTNTDSACILALTVNRNTSDEQNFSTDGMNTNTSSLFKSEELKLITLPERVYANKTERSLPEEETLSFFQSSFTVASIAPYSDIVTIPFITVAFIILCLYYRKNHTHTRQIILTAKTTKPEEYEY